MKKQFMTWLLAITTMSAFAQQATVTGPDSFLKVNVSVKQGIPVYSVTYKDKTILEDSPLGFIANVGDFSRDMTFTGQKENKIDKVIDATHPYAVEVSTNAMKACELSNTRYIRFERESLINQINYDNKYLVETVEEACEVANKVGNNIFIGTGSKNLSIYKELIKNKNLITRVLPTSEVLISCENLGFNADNIIAMKGPFTQEMNESTYKQYDIDLVITKERGITGGY